jgi:hypothetical protein
MITKSHLLWNPFLLLELPPQPNPTQPNPTPHTMYNIMACNTRLLPRRHKAEGSFGSSVWSCSQMVRKWVVRLHTFFGFGDFRMNE